MEECVTLFDPFRAFKLFNEYFNTSQCITIEYIVNKFVLYY